MIARLPMVTHSTVWRIPVSDYEPLPRVWSCPPTFNDRETAHGDAFNGLEHSSLGLRTITTSLVLSTDLLMIARLPTVTHSTVWRIPVSDYEPLPRVWSCPPTFNDRETAHGDAFNGLAHSSLGLRTITTSLVLFTDHLMIARLSMPMRFWRISVSDYELLPRVWSFSDYEPLPRVWSCPPTFNDRETAHGDAFNGLEHSSLGLRTITTSLVLSTDLLMIARLPTVTHSTVWRIPVSDYEPLPRVWSCPPTFNDRETAHGDAFNGLEHSSLGLRTITTSLVLSTDLLMIARLPTVTHSTVWRIPVSDYEPLPRVWSCPPTFNDRETAHGDAFNGLAHSSLGLRTITTSLVLFTDHLMIARLSMPMRFWRISVSDYELLPRVWSFSDYEPLPRVWSCPPTFNDRETAHGDAFNGLEHSSLGLRTITTSLVLSTDLLMIARLPTVTHSTVWRIPVSDYEPLPRVWSCPPTFNDRETAHGDAFNGLAHSSLGLRTITTSLVLSTDHLMIARLSMSMRFWRISVSDYELLPRVWSCPPII
ncbi:hypothetical protein DMN91_000373 [Ooceraea biroi]|uniref:Uncharacterized protein n=1 Tax=Ooceraea biroi TaxID=2015173 RepID=A0A3L8E1P4_OOCBI|nr:hypothetical protein DMN91_000373 [Ooceraea biroi]